MGTNERLSVERNLQELWELVSRIPEGKIASYGALGYALSAPTTGRIVGRWMANCPDDIPWWRVVGHDGRLPIWKREAFMGMQQRQLLEQEGVGFIGERVDMKIHRWEPF